MGNVTAATAGVTATTRMSPYIHDSERSGAMPFLHVDDLALTFGDWGDLPSSLAAIEHFMAGLADLRAMIVARLPEPLPSDTPAGLEDDVAGEAVEA